MKLLIAEVVSVVDIIVVVVASVVVVSAVVDDAVSVEVESKHYRYNILITCYSVASNSCYSWSSVSYAG